MEDTNKDLKILEEIKDIFVHLKNYGYINDIKKDIDKDKAIQAIESTINRYKELEEENSLLIQQNITYKRNINDLKHNNIPVSLVEEKIEEIDKIYKGIPEDEGNFAKAILIKEKQVLQELLEKRK